MARCGCTSAACACLVTGGAGIRVSGTGSETNPYVVEAIGSGITGALETTNTSTVSLALTGSGTTASPYDLRATAHVSMTELEDVAAGAVPAAGQVPVWSGTAWTFAVPPSTPPGAVSTTVGLLGDGAAANPIRVRTSGTWGTSPLNQMGTNSTLAAPVFVDSAGNLRVLGDVKLSRVTSGTASNPTNWLDWNDGHLHLGVFPSTTAERHIAWHRTESGSNNYAKVYLTQNGGLPAMSVLVAQGITAEPNVVTLDRQSGLYQRSDGHTFRIEWPTTASGITRPLPFAVAGGAATLTGSANAVRTQTVTYPGSRFKHAPWTFVSSHTGTVNPSTTNTEIWSETGNSLASFTIGVNRTNTTSVGVHWLAVQLDNPTSSTLAEGSPLQRFYGQVADTWRVHEAALLEAGSFVLCPTVGCENRDLAIAVDETWKDSDGHAHPVDEFSCGVCGTRLLLGGGVVPTDPYIG